MRLRQGRQNGIIIIRKAAVILYYTKIYDSPLGGITIAARGDALTGLWFDGQKHFAATLPPEHEAGPLPVLYTAARWLDQYFAGKKPDFLPPLAPVGTPFRRVVWDILLRIPYGQTMTYGAIAALYSKQSGKPMSAQAVGGAVGHNPIALFIPCHRVIGSDGSLTGYAGGLDRKLALLRLEGIDAAPIPISGGRPAR